MNAILAYLSLFVKSKNSRSEERESLYTITDSYLTFFLLITRTIAVIETTASNTNPKIGAVSPVFTVSFPESLYTITDSYLTFFLLITRTIAVIETTASNTNPKIGAVSPVFTVSFPP